MRRSRMMLRATMAALVAALGVPASAAPAAAESAGMAVFAGTGVAGFSGDGGQAAQAQLANPVGVAVGANGTVYIADTGNRVVRAVSQDGVIRTVAGTGPGQQTVTALPSGGVRRGTEVTLAGPTGVAVGTDGTVYIADGEAFRVLALSARGELSAFAGTGVRGFTGDGGPATRAQLGAVKGLAVGADGTVYIGDLGSRRVRAVTPDGVIQSVMGDGSPDPVGGGVATEAGLPYIETLAVDGSGAVWVTSTVLQRFRNGALATATWAGTGRWALSEAFGPLPETAMTGTYAVAAAGETLHALDQGGLRRLRPDGAVDTVVETDRIYGPLAVSAGGDVYVVDNAGDQLRVVRAAAPGGDGDGSGGRWWLVAAAAAVAVLLVAAVVGYRVSRRRRARTTG